MNSSTGHQPYLSIVAATRNDNHGGDLLKRTSCFVRGIYHQAKKFNFPIELIIVEWNPPKDKPLLKDVLPLPSKDDLVKLRFIVVPNEVHQQFKNDKILPLHQMIAKNVGIRRARGSFILATNIDILFSDECFKELSKKNLKENYFYRTIRCDVPKKIMDIENINKQLNFAKKNIIKKIGLTKNFKHVHYFPDLLFYFPNLLYIIDNIFGLFSLNKEDKKNINFLNTNACGDFTLMSKNSWKKIKGYYELDMFPLHIDSMALIAAYAIDIKQHTFPKKMCTYHIYHENGWESDYKEPEDFIHLMERRPGLDWNGVYYGGKKLIAQGRNYDLNDDNWGINHIDLQEFEFGILNNNDE